MVIKNFVHVGGMPQHSSTAVMHKPGLTGNFANIPNGEEKLKAKAEKAVEIDYNKRIREAALVLKELEDKRETLLKEYDVLKELKIQEGADVLAKAKKDAAEITKATEEETELDKQGIEEDRERILTEAMETG